MPKPKLIATILSVAMLFVALGAVSTSCKDRVDPPSPQGDGELVFNVLTRSHGTDNSINKDNADLEDKVELSTLKTYPAVQGLRFVAEPTPQDVKVKIDQPGYFLAERDLFSISAGTIHDVYTDGRVDLTKYQPLSPKHPLNLSKQMFESDEPADRAGVFGPPFIMQAIYDKFSIAPSGVGTQAKVKYRPHNDLTASMQTDDKILLSRFCAKVVVTIRREKDEPGILSPKVDYGRISAMLKGIPSAVPFEIPLSTDAVLGDSFDANTSFDLLGTDLSTTKVFYLPPTLQTDSTKAIRLSFKVVDKLKREREVEVVLTDTVKDAKPRVYMPIESNKKYIVNIVLGEVYLPKVTIDVLPWNQIPTVSYTLTSSLHRDDSPVVPMDLLSSVNVLVPFSNLATDVVPFTWSHFYFTSYFASKEEFTTRRYIQPKEGNNTSHAKLHNTYLCPNGYHIMQAREALATFLPFRKDGASVDYPSFNAVGVEKKMIFDETHSFRFGPCLLQENVGDVANPSIDNFYTKDRNTIYAVRYARTKIAKDENPVSWVDLGEKLRTLVKYEIVPIDLPHDAVYSDNNATYPPYWDKGVALNGYLLDTNGDYAKSDPECYVKNYERQYLFRITYRWVGDSYPQITSAKALADLAETDTNLFQIGRKGVKYRESMMTGIYNSDDNTVKGMLQYLFYYVWGDGTTTNEGDPCIFQMGISKDANPVYLSDDHNNSPSPKDLLSYFGGGFVTKAETYCFKPTAGTASKYRVPIRCIRDLPSYEIIK